MTVTHCNSTYTLRARMNPKLPSGDRNLRQRQGHRTGTTFQQQRQPSWCKAESLRPACQIPQRQRPQSKFPRGKRMGTAVRQRHQPSAESSLRECRSGTTPERRHPLRQVQTYARTHARRQAGKQVVRKHKSQRYMARSSYDSAQPAGTQALRFIHEVWKRYHDNPRQSHARTQRATSFRHPPRVRATTK